MASSSPQVDHESATISLVAIVGGVVGVVVSLMAFTVLSSPQATEAGTLERVASYVLWTQPFIYVMSGLLAGAGDRRWGPVRAPIIGVFLASMCWFMLRRRALLPSEPNILVYLLPAGALFALGGAMVAPLVRRFISVLVSATVIIGVVAFLIAYLNLGSISGQVTREVISRAQGMTMSMNTVPVPGARVALLDADQQTILYLTSTGASGRYHISHVPIGRYTLRVWDPATSAVISESVEVDRTITGGTRWQTVALPTLTHDSGRLFY